MMKPQNKHLPNIRIGLALFLIGSTSGIAAQDKEEISNASILDAKARAAASEEEAMEHKAKLDALDREIDAIEAKLDEIPEGPIRHDAKLRLEKLKDRRTELRKDYAGAKFDQLKADTRTEYEKIAAWTKEKYHNVKASIQGPQPDAAAKARAATNPELNAARADIALYQMNPSADNKAEVKAALEALEEEIDRLDDHADSMPEGAQRTELEKRINALEDQKDELESDFTKARWDALVANVKREWNELIH